MIPKNSFISEESNIENDRIMLLSPKRLAAYANPTFAIKLRNHTGRIIKTKFPSHHGDTYDLMISLSNLNEKIIEDKILFDDAARNSRKFIVSNIIRGNTEKLPNQEYEINGSVKDTRSWKHIGIFQDIGNKMQISDNITQIYKMSVDTEYNKMTSDQIPEFQFHVEVDGGIEPYFFRVYERTRDQKLKEVRPYQKGANFKIKISEDRVNKSFSEYVVVVKDSMWPDHEFQKQITVKIPGRFD